MALEVQVFGQRELETRIARGGAVMSHLVSIVEPRPFLARPAEDEATPAAVASAFRRVLLLRFSDRLEEEAARELMRIRPLARPHPELLAHFDARLGSKLADATEAVLEERLKVMRGRIREAAARAKGPGQSSADSSSSR